MLNNMVREDIPSYEMPVESTLPSDIQYSPLSNCQSRLLNAVPIILDKELPRVFGVNMISGKYVNERDAGRHGDR